MAIKNRVLALTWSAPHLGFAAFESPSQLLASGTRRSSKISREAKYSAYLREPIHRLITKFSPSVIVVGSTQKQKRIESNALGRIARTEAARAGIEIVLVKDAHVDEAFGKFTEPTRYNLAAWSAIFFPTLTAQFSRLDHKPQYLPLFDAVSLGIAYFGCFGEYQLELSNASSTGFESQMAS